MKELLEKYFDILWPVNRSLTGNGNRETLRILSEISEINIKEVRSGTECFDWKIPSEWNVQEAFIKDSKGNIIADFKKNNLHLLGYSGSFSGKLNLKKLKEHLFCLPDQPDVIPYLTSYYSRKWGFCITENQLKSLKEDTYEVYVDAVHNENGSMTYGETILNGMTENEILFSTYICHPSMANNELSGPLVTSFICKELKKIKNRKFTYRFLYLPETIGAIYYLSDKGEHLKKNLAAGYVVTCIGDKGNFTYKKSRRGDSLADRAAELALKQNETDYTVENFFPTGSDERQYCSPGFNLPVGSLMRTRYGKYKEYHTSSDDKNFISFEAMEKSVEIYLKIIDILEKNTVYLNLFPNCEPQLGKRGLYPEIGSEKNTADYVSALMWVLNLSDGTKDTISVSEISGLNFAKIAEASKLLEEKGLLKKHDSKL